MGERGSLEARGNTRAVFFDRDGILNEAIVRAGRPYSPRTMAEFRVLDEARAACRLLGAFGFKLLCVTNQPDIARGDIDPALVDAFHGVLRDALSLCDVLVCPHDDADNCPCRKPKPGLLLASASKYNVDLSDSFVIGDRWRDIAAGRAAGCRTAWVDRGYSERLAIDSDFVTTSVLSAAEWILDVSRDSERNGLK
jgi:D-glycero-D-manno-heptose 1,7-bisphosphate phosphatase